MVTLNRPLRSVCIFEYGFHKLIIIIIIIKIIIIKYLYSAYTFKF